MLPDEPWRRLRRFTNARIGMGRAGNGLPTKHLLDFRVAHAMARDSVHSALDFDALEQALTSRIAHCPQIIRIASRVTDRAEYLQRPDLGRRVVEADIVKLETGEWDIVFVIADGLSAEAVSRNAPDLLAETLPQLSSLRVGPLVLAGQGRVGIGDEIGERLGARMVVMLIGERPGLSSPASLGAYITWQPRLGRQNSERNCISNIHADGLVPPVAAVRLVSLIRGAMKMELTGVGLKDRGQLIEGEAPD
ncbi:ethanolamine ammonia-lyase subunit EutC [Marinobacter nanhaiticus D15-8W]|nr:ethanolamine ammonia-lyase subunit EutC [Marinobacter nanhaiticus]BES72353.1 ethanolamine ammonia-lyase subunit EutC [Marinobacter nanhaiticus D15-8W]